MSSEVGPSRGSAARVRRVTATTRDRVWPRSDPPLGVFQFSLVLSTTPFHAYSSISYENGTQKALQREEKIGSATGRPQGLSDQKME
jgi:hypothetical protein